MWSILLKQSKTEAERVNFKAKDAASFSISVINQTIRWMKEQFGEGTNLESIIKRLHVVMNKKTEYLLKYSKKSIAESEPIWNRLYEASGRGDKDCNVCGLKHPIVDDLHDGMEKEPIHEALLHGAWQEAVRRASNLCDNNQYTKTRLAVSIILRDKLWRGCIALWEVGWYLDRRLKQAILDIYQSLMLYPRNPYKPLLVFRGFHLEDAITARILIALGHQEGMQFIRFSKLFGNSSELIKAKACWNQLNAPTARQGRQYAAQLYSLISNKWMVQQLNDQENVCPEDRGIVEGIVATSMNPLLIFSNCQNTKILSTFLANIAPPAASSYVAPKPLNLAPKPKPDRKLNKNQSGDLKPPKKEKQQTLSFPEEKFVPKSHSGLSAKYIKEIEDKFHPSEHASKASSTGFVAIAPLNSSQIRSYYRLYRQLEGLERLVDDLNPLSLHGMVDNDEGIVTPGAVIPVPSVRSPFQEPAELVDAATIAQQEARIKDPVAKIPLSIDDLNGESARLKMQTKSRGSSALESVQNTLEIEDSLDLVPNPTPKSSIHGYMSDDSNEPKHSRAKPAEFSHNIGNHLVGKQVAKKEKKENVAYSDASWETPSMTVPSIINQPSIFRESHVPKKLQDHYEENEENIDFSMQSRNHSLPHLTPNGIHDWERKPFPNNHIHPYERVKSQKMNEARMALASPFVQEAMQLQSLAEDLPPMAPTSSQTPTFEMSRQMDYMFRTQKWILMLRRMKMNIKKWKRDIREYIRYLNLIAARNIYMERNLERKNLRDEHLRAEQEVEAAAMLQNS